MGFTVYAIKDKFGKIYKGMTGNFSQRLYYHGNNFSRWTKGRGPFEIIFTKEFKSKSEAIKYEKFLKSGTGRMFLKNLRRCSSAGRATVL